MRAFQVFCTYLMLNAVYADVSHLKYLPPMMMHNNGNFNNNGAYFPATTTSIEKQILKELPEQIEYVQSKEYGNRMSSSPHMMTMTMTSMPMPMPMTVPAEEMLPPPMDSQYILKNFGDGSIVTKQPLADKVHSMPMTMEFQMPSPQYLPPQQGIDSYMQDQQMNIEQRLPMPMPMERQNVEPKLEIAQEAEPAHMLTPNGYQYKVGSSFSNSAMMKRFRFKQ